MEQHLDVLVFGWCWLMMKVDDETPFSKIVLGNQLNQFILEERFIGVIVTSKRHTTPVFKIFSPHPIRVLCTASFYLCKILEKLRLTCTRHYYIRGREPGGRRDTACRSGIGVLALASSTRRIRAN